MAYVPAPSYNMQPIDVWGSFQQGAQVAGALRARREEREQRQAYGEAFGQGGWGGVAETAGGMGDLETAQSAQGVQAEQEEAGIARAQRNATTLANVATSLGQIPYEQRRSRIQQMLPMLVQQGVEEQEILGFDPTDENLANVRALQGRFSQYVDIREHEGALVGQRSDGTFDVLREAQPEWQTNGTQPYRVTAQGQVEMGQGQIPHRPAGGGLGEDQYRVLTPAEIEEQGLPPGSYQRNTANGQITVVGRTRGQYTDAASSSAQYASRMAAADQTLAQLESLHTDPEGVFLAQGGMGSENERLVRQAQREFVNAILRRESGAVIVDSEFASAAQQYFPQPGDTMAVIEQKRAARQRSIQGLINASQGAYEEWYGEGSGAALPPPAPPTGSVIGSVVGRAFSGGLESMSIEDLEALLADIENANR